MAWTAIGTFRESAATLWALVPFAARGAALPGHPFDVLYTYGFQRWTAGPPLPEAGNKRAQTEGLTNCRFQHGDASNLNELTDKQFDLVVSIFGAMFAPKPFDVAKEMVRVTRPGGRIVMSQGHVHVQDSNAAGRVRG